MKKITLCLILILALVIVPVAIFVAEGTAEVDTYQELVDALADSSKTKITLVGSFALDDMVVVDRTVTVDGAGYEITTKSGVVKSFEIHNTADTEIDVTFENITITNATSYGRAIDTRNDKINLTLDGVKLNTTSAQNNQALTLGGSDMEGLTVKMINSSATSAGISGYGIITFVPGELLIKDSSITGYAALYVKSGSEGLKVDVINSTLEGNNNHLAVDANGKETNNDFGTIVTEESNITINVDNNSTIKSTGNGTATQFIVSDKTQDSKGNTINITSATIDAKGPFAYMGNANTELSVGLGVTSNVEIPEEYLPEDVAIKYDEETGKTTIVKRTITVDLSRALDNIENSSEVEKILLDSFKEWEKYDISYANTNIKLSLVVEEFTDKMVGEIPLEIWEGFEDALNKKDENAKMTKNFFDVQILLSADNNEERRISLTKLVKPITFKVELPKLEELSEDYERKYYSVRYHYSDIIRDEEVIEYGVLDAKSEDGKTLSFTSDKFPVFGIGYTDVKKEVVTPPADDGDTGNENNTGDTTVIPPADDGNTENTTVTPPPADNDSKDTTDTSNNDKNEEDVPQTGDNVILYVALAAIAVFGIVKVKKINTSKRKH